MQAPSIPDPRVTMLGLGRPDRRAVVLRDGAGRPVGVSDDGLVATFPDAEMDVLSAVRYATRGVSQPELWCDTSETLTLAQYQFLARIGYKGCFRYVPLAGGGGGIQPSEIQAALSVRCPDGTPFSLMFVQFGRGSNINEDTGKADGAALATYLGGLLVPAAVYGSLDLSPATASLCVAYCNASYGAAVAGGRIATSVPAYMEPGYPLTSSQRYSELEVHAYWATAANDPNRMVASRGCQVVQAWGSNNGEFFPEQGLVIDADLVQRDYFRSYPVALCAAA